MEYFWSVIIFMIGTVIGSFLSVISGRFNSGLSYFKGRSFCFSCNTELKKKDLFPVFSFLFLKGRCRYCGDRISWETLITEVLMGFLALLAAFKSGFLYSLPYDLSVFPSFDFLILVSIFASILLITIYDLKHYIIPDAFLISLGVFVFIYQIVMNIASGGTLSGFFYFLANQLLAGLLLVVPFLLIFLLSKGLWIGFGDVKYILVIGFFLGLSMGISAIVLSFWIGAFFSMLLILLQKLKIRLPYVGNNLTIKSEIPFGPFLSIGILISFYVNLDLFQINAFIPLLN